LSRAAGDPRLVTTGSPVSAGAVPVSDGPVFLRLVGDRLIAPFGGALHAEDEGTIKRLLGAVHRDLTPAVLVRWLMPSGELRYLEIAFAPGRDGEPASVHAWEVTAHVRSQQTLEHLALHDALTGLANQLLFRQRVADELRRRMRTERHVAVLYADLDGFKQVNDTWGHAAGDILLTTLADRLRNAVRPGDVVARLGGDEFAICCPDIRGPEDALVIAHRVVDDVTAPIALESNLLRVSVAVGVALDDVAGSDDASELIARADLAMYAAKSSGLERVAIAPQSYRSRTEKIGKDDIAGAASGVA
jgi:diguanylate cyclase (GGDEF)-like protein